MATNIYLKFENPALRGECTVPGHEGEIEILSWGNGSTPGSRPIDHRSPQEMIVRKYLDNSSKELTVACSEGKKFGKATLSLYRADGARDNRPILYQTIIMEGVLIENCSVSAGRADKPEEEVTLSYRTVKYDYKAQRIDDHVC